MPTGLLRLNENKELDGELTSDRHTLIDPCWQCFDSRIIQMIMHIVHLTGEKRNATIFLMFIQIPA